MIKLPFFKLLLLSIATFSFLVVLSVSRMGTASAEASICSDSNASSGQNVSSSAFCQDTGTTNPIVGSGGVLTIVINIISAVAGFVAVIMIVISGFQMITSNGNPEKISDARNIIIYSSVGIVVIAIARLIILFITNKIS